MRWKAFRWHDLLLSILSIAFPFWAYALLWAGDTRQGRIANKIPDPAFLKSAIFSLKFAIPILLAIAIIFINIRKVLKEAVAKKTLHNYLDFLHEKFFPHGFSGLDRNYRVSLFVPTRWLKLKFIPYPCLHKYLVLFTRSGDIFPKSKIAWDITESENNARFDGIAGYAWATGNLVKKPNLPDYDGGGEIEKQQYLEQTYLTVDNAKKLNVRSRSFQALVIKNKMGEKVGLLMMESVSENGLDNLQEEMWIDISRTLQALFVS